MPPYRTKEHKWRFAYFSSKFSRQLVGLSGTAKRHEVLPQLLFSQSMLMHMNKLAYHLNTFRIKAFCFINTITETMAIGRVCMCECVCLCIKIMIFFMQIQTEHNALCNDSAASILFPNNIIIIIMIVVNLTCLFSRFVSISG